MSFTTERHGRRDLTELEHHIHCLETEAYRSVLKAFISQSDLLTWVSILNLLSVIQFVSVSSILLQIFSLHVSYLLNYCLCLQGKEGLMTDMRKELNVTDLEHGEILAAVNSDESVKRIRCL